LYNVPGRTASNMTAATTVRLATDFENIIAIKEASGDINQVMTIIKNKPADFMLISGEDALNFPIISCGGVGVISVLANSKPNLCSKVVNLSLDANNKAAAIAHYNTLDFIDLLFAEGNPVGVKAAMAIQGICGNDVRMPLLRASAALQDKLKVALDRF